MNTIESNQKWIFIVLFSVIALLINGTQGFGVTQRAVFITATPQIPPSPQQTQATLAAQKSAQQATQAAAEHAKFLSKYVNEGFTHLSGKQNVAIVVSANDNSSSAAVATALAQHFRGSSVQISTSFFTRAFTADGLFDDILSGSREPFGKLDLTKSVDTLVLAREDIQYSQNPALENVTTATIQLTVNVVPVAGVGGIQSWNFSASGPGFSNEVARHAAEERLIKQIANDPKMSLN